MKNMVIMGRIVAPYGVLGWLKVLPDTELFDGLLNYENWWVGKDNDWREHQVEQAKVHNDVLLVKFAGVNDRDDAFACKGKQVAVPRDSLPEADEDEFYWSDLIGLQVSNQQGVDFGVITDVFETGANDVIVVKPLISPNELVQIVPNAMAEEHGQHKKDPKKSYEDERLIPFIGSVIINVDLESKKMLVDWDADY
jgi:16S rRNA processing protein RimM